MFVLQSLEEPDKFIIQFCYEEMRHLQCLTPLNNSDLTKTLLTLILDALENSSCERTPT